MTIFAGKKSINMRIAIVLFITGLLLSCGTPKKSVETTAAAAPEKTTDIQMDSLSYSVGILVAQNLKSQGFDKLDAPSLAQGIADVLSGAETRLDVNQANAVVQGYMMEKSQAAGKENLEKGRKFLEENGKREGVVTTASGLQYEVINSGNGSSPKATDKVTVHYHGTLIDGTVFDSSVERGQPATFPVNGVIKGWVEALQLMKVGDKWKLFIPSELAYGSRGAGGDIGPNEVLIFEVELLSID
jgi:FKBP-type peptidyl-prolyl cis-trans isomerase FklB